MGVLSCDSCTGVRPTRMRTLVLRLKCRQEWWCRMEEGVGAKKAKYEDLNVEARARYEEEKTTWGHCGVAGLTSSSLSMSTALAVPVDFSSSSSAMQSFIMIAPTVPPSLATTPNLETPSLSIRRHRRHRRQVLCPSSFHIV